MKSIMLALTLISGSALSSNQKYDFENATNTAYKNIIKGNLSEGCKDLMVAYSVKSELDGMEGLVGLDIGINKTLYNLGSFKAVEKNDIENTVTLYVYDSDYNRSISILQTLKDKKVIDKKLELEIQKALNFQPRYKIVIDENTDQIQGIYEGYKFSNDFKIICE